MLEAQFSYVMDALKKIKQHNLKYIDVKPSVQRDFCQTMQDKMVGTAWTSGCNSWYLSDSGKNFTLWPDYTFNYIRGTKHLNLTEYTAEKID